MSKETRIARREARKEKIKIPFKDRPIADILKKAAPTILDIVGDIVPGASAIKTIANMVFKDKTISPADKEAIQKELDRELKEYELYVEDMKRASDMYSSTGHRMADKIADRVIKWNLWIIIIAIVFELLFIYYIDDKILIATISTIVGGVTTALLQERQQIINFFFGSSRGSKTKDKRIQ